jgi:hypothetical protein
MPEFNLGNVVGLLRSQTPPTKKYVLWGKILNPSFPDLVELNYWDDLTGAWTPVTDPTTQHWLRPVIDNTIAAPPPTPSEGDRYLIPDSGASGAWAGREDQVTTYKNGAWVFQIPLDGFIVSVRTEANKLFDYRGTHGDGGAWFENDFQVPIAPGTYIPSTEKGAINGVATLGGDTKIPAVQINGATLPFSPAVVPNWPVGTDTVKEALDYLVLAIGGGVNLSRVTLPTSGSTITVDLVGLKQLAYVGVDVIDGPRTWEFDNIVNVVNVPFISVEFDGGGAGYEQEMPAETKMLKFDGTWNSVDKEWTPEEPGKYLLHFDFDGTDYLLTIQGPF